MAIGRAGGDRGCDMHGSMRRRSAGARTVAVAAVLVTVALGAPPMASAARGAAGTGAAAPSSSTCTPVLTQPAATPGYADTPWPTEHADAWRTHAAPTGLPANVGRLKLTATSVTLPAEPVWGYVGTGGKVYVIGGSPYLLNMFTQMMLGASKDRIPALTVRSLLASTQVTPYVAEIDTTTMKVDVLPLESGEAVNYTGGLLVHANGYLYAVVRAVLYKIDPATFTIVASTPLPLGPDASGQPTNRMTTYNGIAATADGDLILKGWASSGGSAGAPGTLLRIDPDDLAITAQIQSTAIA